MKRKNVHFFLNFSFVIPFKRDNPTGYPSQVSRAFSSNPHIMHELSCHHYHDEHAFTLMKTKKIFRDIVVQFRKTHTSNLLEIIYLHVFGLCMHVNECSCLIVSILSDCDGSGWLHEYTHTHKTRVQSGNYFFSFFFSPFLSCCFDDYYYYTLKKMRKHIEKKICRIDYVNVVSRCRERKESDVFHCIFVCLTFICF